MLEVEPVSSSWARRHNNGETPQSFKGPVWDFAARLIVFLVGRALMCRVAESHRGFVTQQEVSHPLEPKIAISGDPSRGMHKGMRHHNTKHSWGNLISRTGTITNRNFSSNAPDWLSQGLSIIHLSTLNDHDQRPFRIGLGVRNSRIKKVSYFTCFYHFDSWSTRERAPFVRYRQISLQYTDVV